MNGMVLGKIVGPSAAAAGRVVAAANEETAQLEINKKTLAWTCDEERDSK